MCRFFRKGKWDQRSIKAKSFLFFKLLRDRKAFENAPELSCLGVGSFLIDVKVVIKRCKLPMSLINSSAEVKLVQK